MVPIAINPFFFVVALLIGWMSSMNIGLTAVWGIVITISVLVHEYGHALTAIAFGQQARIELVPFGGLTHRKGPKLSLWKEFLIVLNGPCAGFLLGLIALWTASLLGFPETTVGYGLTVAIYVNFFWTFLNLMPIYPLDGGHLLSIFLQGIIGFRGIRLSLLISMVFGLCLSLFFFAVGLIIAGAIILILSFESFRSWSAMSTYTESDHQEHNQALLKKAHESILEGDESSAIQILEKIRSEVKEGFIFVTATEYLAKILDDQGEHKAAYDLIKPIRKQMDADGRRLLHKSAYYMKDYPLVAEIGDQVFQEYPSYRIAEINALAHASLQETEAAAGWLQRAKTEGKEDISETINMPEFDAIRSHEVIQSFLK